MRAAMANRVYQTTRWPLFEPRVTRLRNRAVLHLSMNLLVADWASIWLLLGDMRPGGPSPPRVLRLRADHPGPAAGPRGPGPLAEHGVPNGRALAC